ncbi:MAG: OFA family MFS transporter [Deltaproteobacteria bacterium]|nr:OFA family MFS transporter [Deltaproteobacteria bacterium]
MTEQSRNRGWIVTFSGTGINLALGVLYAWSVIKAAIETRIDAGAWTWDKASLNDPYVVALVVFAFMMIPGGRMLDKWGPRITSSVGGLLVGLGFLVASSSSSLWVWILGFGCLAGSGIGLAYAAATPAAIKWFPPRRTGLIAGLVISGFGLAAAYIAPLATHMQRSYGIGSTMLILGLIFLVVVIGLSQLLSNPPEGFKPQETTEQTATKASAAPVDCTWKEMMSTPAFWLIWFVFFIGAGAGLMVIGAANSMAKAAFAETAWLALTVLALGNAAGRIIAGSLSDKIGRKATLVAFMLFQAAIIFSLLAMPKDSATLILLVATLIGFNYGSNLTLFPSITKDFFGLKNFGLNYGIVFTAWGVGGFVLARVSQMLFENTGSLDYSCIMAGSLLVLGALLALMIRPPKTRPAN